MTIGEKIRAKRIERGLTQKALGELCEMHAEAIRRIELEKGDKVPKIVTLKKISMALKVSIHYFLDLEPDEESLFEKLVGTDYKQIKVYADAFDMDIIEFMKMLTLQGIEMLKALPAGNEPHIINDTLAELNKLKKIEQADKIANEIPSGIIAYSPG